MAATPATPATPAISPAYRLMPFTCHPMRSEAWRPYPAVCGEGKLSRIRRAFFAYFLGETRK